MSTNKPKSMQQVLKENLGSLTQRAADMNQLTQAVRSMVPNPLGDHVLAANLREKTIVVVTDSPVWASRLRFYSQDILSCLKDTGQAQVVNLAVKVRGPQVLDVRGAPRRGHDPSTGQE